jgi:hypothetical protein
MHSHYDLDGPLGVATNIALVGIILGYMLIAVQFYGRFLEVRRHASAYQNVSSAPASAFLQLMGIFILCSLTGYLPRLFSFPAPLFVGMHVVLALWTWGYILSRSAERIATALARA